MIDEESWMCETIFEQKKKRWENDPILLPKWSKYGRKLLEKLSSPNTWADKFRRKWFPRETYYKPTSM